MTEVRVELLLGRIVRDAAGRRIGRIRGVKAVREGSQCFVKEYHVGTAALLERLGLVTAHLVGIPARGQPFIIPWHLLDLSDAEHPRLTIRREELPPRAAEE